MKKLLAVLLLAAALWPFLDRSPLATTGRWFPRALLVDVNIGHLNLAEAVRTADRTFKGEAKIRHTVQIYITRYCCGANNTGS